MRAGQAHREQAVQVGAVYVFRRDGHGTPLDLSDDFWREEDSFSTPDGAENTGFGVSVSIYGDRMIVGAMNDERVRTFSGSAYIFFAPECVPLIPTISTWGVMTLLLLLPVTGILVIWRRLRCGEPNVGVWFPDVLSCLSPDLSQQHVR